MSGSNVRIRLPPSKYDPALSAFNKAIELNPTHARAYCNRGLVYNAKEKDALAISDYTRAVKLDPKYSEAYYYRSMTYYLKGEFDKAWEDVRKAKGSGCQLCPTFLEQLRSGSQGKECKTGDADK